MEIELQFGLKSEAIENAQEFSKHDLIGGILTSPLHIESRVRKSASHRKHLL